MRSTHSVAVFLCRPVHDKKNEQKLTYKIYIENVNYILYTKKVWTRKTKIEEKAFNEANSEHSEVGMSDE